MEGPAVADTVWYLRPDSNGKRVPRAVGVGRWVERGTGTGTGAGKRAMGSYLVLLNLISIAVVLEAFFLPLFPFYYADKSHFTGTHQRSIQSEGECTAV